MAVSGGLVAAGPGHSIPRTAWELRIRTERWRIDSAVISPDAVALRIVETSLRAAGSNPPRLHRPRDQARGVSEVPDLNRVIGPAHRMARAARFAPLHPTAARTVERARLRPTAARTAELERLPVIDLLRPRAVADLAQLLLLAMEAVSMVEAAEEAVFTAVVVEAAARMEGATGNTCSITV
jgi:hypothetical protein